MPYGASADEGLADAVDANRRQHARWLADLFHRFLKRDRVQHGGQHSHVVGGGAGDVAVFGEGRTADKISAANDHRQFHAHLRDFNALAGDPLEFCRLDPKASLVAESFTADFQQDPLVDRSAGLRHRARHYSDDCRVGEHSPFGDEKPIMIVPMSIVLIGYRGSGKTTAGRKLADRLWQPFVDVDERIVSGLESPIKEIFEQDGEPHYRDIESGGLEEVIALPPCVIALGGGTLDREKQSSRNSLPRAIA